MLKYPITYTDYNGNQRTEEHYFNLNKSEIVKMEMSVKGGLAEMIKRIIDAQDAPAIMEIFEDLIRKSYGVKDPDGKGFNKDPKHFEEFKNTLAYDQLFMDLITDAKKASDFINQIIPSDVGNSNNANHPANK